MMPTPFAGQSALVTGGASGIGRATALLLARRGARVVVTDVSEEGVAETVRLVAADGGTAIGRRVDVTVDAEVAAAVAAAVETFGGLDVAVNVAGVGGVQAPTADYAEDAWLRVVDVNLTGVWRAMRHEIPAMLRPGTARAGGAIVNVSSASGLVGFPMHAAYSASKHGVVGLTRTAALEYARHGLRINAICPGFVDTPMVALMTGKDPEIERALGNRMPIGRLGTVEEVAAAIAWMASDEAAFMVGHALAYDGGIAAA
jgi:NAD(P)-dependent dehydrogenase (short-subunit alcohol dehydrogenase family)